MGPSVAFIKSLKVQVYEQLGNLSEHEQNVTHVLKLKRN